MVHHDSAEVVEGVRPHPWERSAIQRVRRRVRLLLTVGGASREETSAPLPLAFASDAGLASGGLGGTPTAPRGLKLAVIGRPNVGKSSLVNRLLGEERMVVHVEAGTTRDAVATPLEWGGHPMLVADTAGIRTPQAGGQHREELDRMAVRRAQQRRRLRLGLGCGLWEDQAALTKAWIEDRSFEPAAERAEIEAMRARWKHAVLKA